MRALTIRETRAALGAIERLLDAEGEVIITRHGKAVARVLPIRRPDRPDHATLRRRMRPLEWPSAALVRQERDERG